MEKALPLKKLAAQVCRVWLAERERYGLGDVPPPRVERGTSYCNSCYVPAAKATQHRIIVCLVAGRGTALHEVAHALSPLRGDSHGAEFVGVLIGLYIRHAKIAVPVAELVSQARIFGGLDVDEDWIR